MLQTSARLLKLLTLLETRRDWSGAELADRLGITPRTVRRDVDKLRELGYPVNATTGTAGGYRLGAGASLPPLLLDDDEAVAVAVGLGAAANGGIEGIEETSVRALAKLEQVLPSRLRHRVSALRSVTVTLPTYGEESVDPGVLSALAAACRDHERLRFDYRSHGGSETYRSVEPHRLAHTGRRWYLLAWDLDRDDWRIFRVDRLTPKIPTGPRFAPREPPAGDITEYIGRSVNTGAYPHRVRVTFHAPAEVVRRRVSPQWGTVTPDGDGRCVLESRAGDYDGLATFLAGFGVDFEVHEPDDLKEHIRGLAERLRRAAFT